MAKDTKLKAALNRHKGVDHSLEKQKKFQKEAEKRKRQRTQDKPDGAALWPRLDPAGEGDDAGDDDDDDDGVHILAGDVSELQKEEIAANEAQLRERTNGEVDGWETDESQDALPNDDDDDGDDQDERGSEIGAMEDESDSESEDESLIPSARGKTNGRVPEDDADAEDIPLSDIESLASEDRADVVPHQRLTINNTSALQRSLQSFALPLGLPFSAVQTVTSAEPVAIADVDDDLGRELAFYRQSLTAVTEARSLLKREGVPFSRPTDYFAEMVKSEEQMGKVRQKLVDEAARKKASADARRQRDLKKFGKAVQVAKLQERQKEKRETLDRINTLKRKRQGAELTNATEDDMFDVALEDAAVTAKNDRSARKAQNSADGLNRKRQKKDEKFGFGGKKRFSKSNDARSTGDLSGYSVRKMKGSKPGKQRPGKSRRAKMS